MKLPVSVMIGIALVVIVLVAIIIFFTSSGGSAARRTALQNTFSQNCISICAMPNKNNINLATTYPQWQSACEELYGVAPGAFVQCLELCQCGQVADPCAYLCTFRDSLADLWDSFCNDIRTNIRTQAKYGSCSCIC